MLWKGQPNSCLKRSMRPDKLRRIYLRQEWAFMKRHCKFETTYERFSLFFSGEMLIHFASFSFRRSLTATAQNRDFCTNSKRKILISPASYLRFINTLSSMHADSNTKLEDRKSRLEKLIQKVQGIETQVTMNTVNWAGKRRQLFSLHISTPNLLCR